MRPLYLFAFLVALTVTASAQTSGPFVRRETGLPRFMLPRTLMGVDGESRFDAPVAALIADGYDPTLPARLQGALEKTLASVDARIRRGVVAAVVMPGLGEWTGAAGYSDSSHPARADMSIEIASITKTFTAATILQLADEGKISLDDSLHRWLPSFARIDSTTTIRQLLDHSSGIYDYISDDPGYVVLSDIYVFNPTRSWKPEEILDYVGDPNFKPGKSTRYSNTNYVLLGMVIEKVTGNKAGDEIRRRFLTPLHLQNSYPGWENGGTGEFIHGWSEGIIDPIEESDLDTIPKTGIFSAFWTAGGMVSTVSDLARWADALYSGRVLSQKSTEAMLTFKGRIGPDSVGLGAFRSPPFTRGLYGHTGSLPGYTSWAFSIPKDSVSVSFALNYTHSTINDGFERFEAALLDEIYRQTGSSVAASPATAMLALHQNYPNPFTEETSISYDLPSTGHVTIEVADALGEIVARPVDGTLEAGPHTVRLSGKELGSGTYFCTLRLNGARVLRSMQIVR